MAGFGTCPVCNKKGFTRKGAMMCTRCEKASVPAVFTSPEERSNAAPAPAARSSRKKRPRILGGRVIVGGDE